MTRLYRQLLLALVVVSLGGGALVVLYSSEILGKDEREKKHPNHDAFLIFRKDDVLEGVLFTRSTTITFLRTGEHEFRITTPVRALADTTAIESAIERMSELRVDPVETDKTPLEVMKTYELVHPIASLSVLVKNGRKALYVGPKNTLGDRYYVTNLDRERVYLADPEFYWTLDRPLEAFRDHRIFPVTASDVKIIEVSGRAGLAYRLTRTEEGWLVSDKSGASFPADEGQVHFLLVLVSKRLRAEHFLSEDVPSAGGDRLAEFGLDIGWTISVETIRDLRLTARLGAFAETSAAEKKAVMWVEGTSSLVEVPNWAPKDFDKSIAELRDRLLSRFDRDRAFRIELFEGSKTVVLERSETDQAWVLLPSRKPVNPWMPGSLVSSLALLRSNAIELDAPSPAKLREIEIDPPRRRIRIVSKDETILADVRLGKKTGEEIYISGGDMKAIGRYSVRLDDLFTTDDGALIKK